MDDERLAIDDERLAIDDERLAIDDERLTRGKKIEDYLKNVISSVKRGSCLRRGPHVKQKVFSYADS